VARQLLVVIYDHPGSSELEHEELNGMVGFLDSKIVFHVNLSSKRLAGCCFSSYVKEQIA